MRIKLPKTSLSIGSSIKNFASKLRGSWKDRRVKNHKADSGQRAERDVDGVLNNIFQTLKDRAVELQKQEGISKQYLIKNTDYIQDKSGNWALPPHVHPAVALMQDEGEAGILKDINQIVTEEHNKVCGALDRFIENESIIRAAMLEAGRVRNEIDDDTVSVVSLSDPEADVLLAELDELLAEDDMQPLSEAELELLEREAEQELAEEDPEHFIHFSTEPVPDLKSGALQENEPTRSSLDSVELEELLEKAKGPTSDEMDQIFNRAIEDVRMEDLVKQLEDLPPPPKALKEYKELSQNFKRTRAVPRKRSPKPPQLSP